MYTDLYSQIIRYEDGHLDESEIVKMFQYIIDHDLDSELPGHYGRTAANLISQGLIVRK